MGGSNQFDPAGWESALIAHYLSTDGPFGSGPITYIDATPEELSKACNKPGGPSLSPEQARDQFVGSFAIGEIRNVLAGRTLPSSPSASRFASFRFLYLTCMVPALNPEWIETTGHHQFRRNLGELTEGSGAAIQAVGAIPKLWHGLRAELDELHYSGSPFRRLNLPDPHPWPIIGHSLKLSFPSWRDRNALKRILGSGTFENARMLIEHIDRKMSVEGTALQKAWREFLSIYKMRVAVPTSHRFWVLVKSLLEQTTDAAVVSTSPRITLKAFIGLEANDVNFVLTRSDAGDETEVVNGPFEEIIAFIIGPEGSPSLRRRIAAGCVILERSSPGVFTSDVQIDARDFIRVLIHDRLKSSLDPTIQWVPISSGWSVSRQMDEIPNVLRTQLQSPSDPAGESDVLAITDGIKLFSKTYLGRPNVLPFIRALAEDRLSLVPLGATIGDLSLSRFGARSTAISCESAVEGSWDVDLESEQGFATSVRVSFRSDAVIHQQLRDPEADQSRRTIDPDIVSDVAEPATVNRVEGVVEEPCPSDPRVQDLCEILYSMGKSGIPEHRLYPVLKEVLGSNAPAIWDILRVFQESGWLDCFRTVGWRARVWYLRPPALVRLAGVGFLVDGAVPNAWKMHLRTTCNELGIAIRWVAGSGYWSPGTIVVGSGCDDENRMIADLGWPVREAQRPGIAPAPECWVNERHGKGGRIVGSIWSWDDRRFRRSSGVSIDQKDISVVRWQREQGDVHDFYTVAGGAFPELRTPSRCAAILEGHRRLGLALFEVDENGLLRKAREGSLPLEIARHIRLIGCPVGGPEPLEGGEFSYRYHARLHEISWIAESFGCAIGLPRTMDGRPVSGLASRNLRRTPFGRYSRNF